MKHFSLFTFLFLFFSSFSAHAGVQGINVSGTGISQKDSSNYSLTYELVNEAAAWVSDRAIMERFVSKCGDKDFSDQVEWQSKSSGSVHVAKLTFVCFEDLDTDERIKGTAFTFELATSPEFPNSNLVSLTEHDFEKSRTIKGRISMVFVQTTAVLASSYLAVQAAKSLYPGEKDKQLHGGGSAALAAVLTAVAFHYFKLSKNMSMVVGATGSCTVGAVKELVAPYTRGVKEKDDMVANLVGCALGAVGMRIAFEFY